MAQLHENWFTQGTLDFELKKYTLLAYLRDVRSEFRSTRLYPPFAELLTHYRRLETFKREKEQLASEFPKTLKGVDWEKLRLVHEQAGPLGQEMAEIDDIVDYALPQMRGALDEGKADLNKEQIAPVTRYEFSILDADGCEQAAGSAPTYEQAMAEGRHYLSQYLQDGPHALELRKVEVLPIAGNTNECPSQKEH